jgi:isoleucyl-tRNA synthetase
MIQEELNVLEVSFVPDDKVRSYVEYALKPNFRTLGQRGLGKQAQELKKTMAALSPGDAAKLVAKLGGAGKADCGQIELLREDVEVTFTTKEGFSAAGDRLGVVVLETALDERLRDMGFFRELLNRVQTMRKELGLEFTDRIRLSVTGGARVTAIVEASAKELAKEVLATDVSTVAAPAGATSREVDVEGEAVTLAIAKA